MEASEASSYLKKKVHISTFTGKIAWNRTIKTNIQKIFLEDSKIFNETSIAQKTFVNNFTEKWFVPYTWHAMNIAKLWSLSFYF